MEFLLQLLVTMTVLFLLARLGAKLVSHFGLPGLIGEIIIGVVIANIAIGDWSLMGFLGLELPEPGEEIVESSDIYPVVYAFSELGVIFLLFTVGLETKVSDLLGSGKTALVAAILGVILPFVAGMAVVIATGGDMNNALFLAAAMVATSVGITARIIKDMYLMDTREARIIIAAAVIDDVLGMIVLAIVKGIVDSGSVSIVGVASVTLQAVLFVFAVILACKYVVPRIYDYFEDRKSKAKSSGKVPGSTNKLILAVIVCLAMAAFAEFIGLAAIIGAFLAGMLFAEHAWEWELEPKIESITSFMISFFFINVGLQVNISSLTDMSVVVIAVVVICLALVTKFIGCGYGAKLVDRNIDKSGVHIIGVGMMPRGEVGIIIASIGLASTAMSEELYAVVVLMSVATTIIAPPILSKLFRKKYAEEYKILDEDLI
ncbi:MAG: cation:proton antiporter [Candidatus Methanomethylophilaceae archaeon]|nr:cation:proton antiporter [Candidatus Methanomethylophilaceae archaeon]